jgi:hypothetical protein
MGSLSVGALWNPQKRKSRPTENDYMPPLLMQGLPPRGKTDFYGLLKHNTAPCDCLKLGGWLSFGVFLVE